MKKEIAQMKKEAEQRGRILDERIANLVRAIGGLIRPRKWPALNSTAHFARQLSYPPCQRRRRPKRRRMR